MKNEYQIADEFFVEAAGIHVLILDRDYEFAVPLRKSVAIIDGKEYKFHFNSILQWITIDSRDSFKGKKVYFC